MPTTAPPPPKPLKETEAGNYFVSNYPPYAYWRQEQVPEGLMAKVRAALASEQVSAPPAGP